MAQTCFHYFHYIKKKKNTRQTNPRLAKGRLARCACKDVYPSISAGGIKPAARRNRRSRKLCGVFTFTLSKEVSAAFPASRGVLLSSGRQGVELRCCWCVIAVCGGSGGCISRCLASERVKGSGREA